MSQESLNPRVGVGVFVFKDGKFLMGQRRGAHGAGSWSVPGGHLAFNESPEETAIREVREETGLEIGNVSFAAVTNDVFADEGKHYVTLWMKSDWVGGEPTITEPDKFVEQAWVDLIACRIHSSCRGNSCSRVSSLNHSKPSQKSIDPGLR